MERDYQTRLIEDIFTAHVLILANQLKEQKKAKGVTSTGDFTDDAIRLIDQAKHKILQAHQLSS